MNKKSNKKLPNDWAYKLGAILAAVLIWGFITISQNPPEDARHIVPVELRGLADNLTIDKTNYQVNVRVQGSSADISSLRAADIEAYADFTGLLAGDVMVDVVVEVPEGVILISQNIRSITVELKERIYADFELTVDVLDKPATGYTRLNPLLSPAEVRLWGTEDYINIVDKVYVTASVQDLTEGLEKYLSVMVLDDQGNDITTMFTIEPKVAHVVVPVVYDQPEKRVTVHVPLVGEPALGYQVSLISVTPETVRVFGDLSRLQSLYYVETEPVDVTDLKIYEPQTVNLSLPRGLSADRKQVTVALQIEPVNSATVHKTLTMAYNVGEDYTAEVEQQELQIMVYGPETFIATLDEAEITPYVDCTDLEAGEYELPIRVYLPANIILMNISVDTAIVTVHDLNAPPPADEPPDEAEEVVDPEGI